MPPNNEMKCQTNISGIEKNLAKLTEDDNAGRIFLNKETHTGNISRLRFRSDNDIVDGIYLITVFPGSGSHAIVLQISNNGKCFDVFEPNGKKWANNKKFYKLEVSVGDKVKKITKSLSSKQGGLNNSGICGIWSIIISILLNGIAKNIFTNEDKKLFYDFLNNDKAGAIEFIQDIKTNFFDKTQNFESKTEVKNFLEHIRDLLRVTIDNQEKNNITILQPRTSARLSKAAKGGKKSRKSSRSTSKSRTKSRTKSRRRK
tara:strand:+ start:601 stop:1377 length:777 start_codon:yes stop_codon:yes gene_type:complete